MEEQNEIVVFLKFDSAIDANIVKAKLDAYGIPCFLTEENLANLYPGQTFLPFQVRLHLFNHDRERAEAILAEQNLTLDDSITRCPRCQSRFVERDFPKKLHDQFLTGLNVLFFGIFFPEKKVYHCQDCHHEF